jgi:uncharacterized membrane protein YfhO
MILFIPIGIYGITSNIRLLDYCTFIVLGLLLLYIILFRLIPRFKFLNIFLGLLLVFEIMYNMNGSLYRFPYMEPVDNSYEDIISYIKDYDDSLFYRIEDNGDGINNPILYNYYGLDYFMSTIKIDYIKFFKDLGVKNYDTSDNSLLYDGSNHLVSSLFGVRYYIDKYGLNNKYYEKINNINNYDIYKNNKSLSLGYMVNSDIKNLKYNGNGLDYINNIYKSMTNTSDNILRGEDVIKVSDKEYKFKIASSKDFYLLVDIREYGYTASVYLDDEKLENYNNSYMYYIDNKYNKGDEVTLKIELEKEELYDYVLGVYVSYYNDKVYEDNMNILSNNNLGILSINKNGFDGEINVEEEGVLFLSVLYDEDLDIYVDGEKVEKIKLLDTFIGVELDKGNHKITLKYKPSILYLSIIPSVVGLIFLVLCLNKKRS